jgi:hypothetical protein
LFGETSSSSSSCAHFFFFSFLPPRVKIKKK